MLDQIVECLSRLIIELDKSGRGHQSFGLRNFSDLMAEFLEKHASAKECMLIINYITRVKELNPELFALMGGNNSKLVSVLNNFLATNCIDPEINIPRGGFSNISSKLKTKFSKLHQSEKAWLATGALILALMFGTMNETAQSPGDHFSSASFKPVIEITTSSQSNQAISKEGKIMKIENEIVREEQNIIHEAESELSSSIKRKTKKRKVKKSNLVNENQLLEADELLEDNNQQLDSSQFAIYLRSQKTGI